MEALSNIDDVFSMTFYTYDKIRKEGGKSGDSAVSLYIRYIEQARLQGTDSTYSTDSFMMKAMGWSKEKFYKIKPILQNLGLIELKEKRDENGKIISHYIQVNFVIKGETTTVLKSQSLVLPESGKSNTNTICTKYKCFNTKNKYLSENSDEGTTTSEKRKRTTNEHLLVGEKKEQFKKFWDTYPHVSGRSNRKASIPRFLELDTDQVLLGATLLKREVECGIENGQYVKAAERRLKNFTPINESQRQRRLMAIFEWHMRQQDGKRERMERLAQDFPDVDFKKLRQELSEKNSLLHKMTFT